MPPISVTVNQQTYASKTEHIAEFSAPSGNCKVEIRVYPDPNRTRGEACTITYGTNIEYGFLELYAEFSGQCDWLNTRERVRMWESASSSGASPR